MSLYLNELAPWERKNQYYHQIQLGKDLKTQTDSLKTQTQAMIAAQIASSNAIIASQDSIREGIDDLAYGIEEVKEGMQGLKAAFEYGISEVVWQIEQNRQVLTDILKVLTAPLDTQAKELRRRAEDAYSNGWFDEALEDFIESEKKNKYDFSVHISIGMIYLFQKIEKEKAIEYFEKAAKYAKPKSPYHASLALLHAAVIKRDFGLIDEAEKLTSEALSLTPDFSEALYQHALCNCLLGNIPESISSLEKAIAFDKNYCLKVNNDEAFNNIKGPISTLFEKLRNKEMASASSIYKKNKSVLDSINSIMGSFRQTTENGFRVEKYNDSLQQIENMIARNTYFDALAAIKLSEELQITIRKYHTDAIVFVSDLIHQVNQRISNSTREISNSNEKKGSVIQNVLTIIGGVLLIIPGFKSCMFISDQCSGRTPIFNLVFIALGLAAFVGLPILGLFIGKLIGGSISSRTYSNEITPPENLAQELKHSEEKLSQLRGITI